MRIHNVTPDLAERAAARGMGVFEYTQWRSKLRADYKAIGPRWRTRWAAPFLIGVT